MQSMNKLVKLAPKMTTTVSRQMSVISGPPRQQISFAEKLTHGILITVGCAAVPAYVLVNVKNYRGQA